MATKVLLRMAYDDHEAYSRGCVLDIRKKYREDFSKVMNQERANKVFGAEEEFKSLVRREFQKSI